MEQVDLIWKNGEFVRWEDAQVHVLSHGLHYGTGVFEGIRCYETERGPAIFRHATTSTGWRSRPSSTTWSCPTRPRRSRAGDARAAAPQRPQVLLHPPARLPRLRRDGPLRHRRAGRRDHRRLALGRLPRRGEQPARHPRQGLELAADQPGGLDPARQGLRPATSTRSSPRPSRPTPATTRRSCSTSAASSARARARTSSSSATARS